MYRGRKSRLKIARTGIAPTLVRDLPTAANDFKSEWVTTHSRVRVPIRVRARVRVRIRRVTVPVLPCRLQRRGLPRVAQSLRKRGRWWRPGSAEGGERGSG